MTRPRMRPTFEEDVPTSTARVTAQLIAALEDGASPVRGKVGLRSAELLIKRDDRHFWSPCLSLALDDRGPSTVVFGRFSPHPTVWSGFIASYAVLGTVALFSTLFAFAQAAIGQSPTALIGTAVALLLLGTSYASAFMGQSLASEQMYMLRHFFDRCIERALETEPAARTSGNDDA